MLETVYVSQIESLEKLKTTVADQFSKGKYDDIARSIGMFSVIVDPQHTMEEQDKLFRYVLELMKNKIASITGKAYSSWLIEFPKLLAGLVHANEKAANNGSIAMIASREAAHGPFRSVDDFFFWALDDRRLTLSQIMRYLEKTAVAHKR